MIVKALVVGYGTFILVMTIIAYMRFFRDERRRDKP